MPFPKHHFHLIVCNSVLEYVQPGSLSAVQNELVRLLGPGGLVLVLSTSNRLWPKEVHSGKWLSNYVPKCLDCLLGAAAKGDLAI